jgi:hypothetical protein
MVKSSRKKLRKLPLKKQTKEVKQDEVKQDEVKQDEVKEVQQEDYQEDKDYRYYDSENVIKVPAHSSDSLPDGRIITLKTMIKPFQIIYSS